MKSFLCILVYLVFIVGCWDSIPSDKKGTNSSNNQNDAPDSSVEWSKLQNRNGIAYLPNSTNPFTGYGMLNFENGQVEVLAQIKDGYVTRLKQWKENGIQRWEVGFKPKSMGIENIPFESFEDISLENRHGYSMVQFNNGQLKGESNWKNGKKNGSWIGWYQNGQIHRKSNWVEGNLNGLQLAWYENGERKWRANWKNGHKHGICFGWFPDGRKKWESYYKDDKKHGLCSAWYENGNKERESSWKNGEKNGLFSGWFKNGKKERESNYNMGKADGLWSGWYENGQKKRESIWKEDKLMSSISWKPDGQKCSITNLIEGNGIKVSYNSDGTEQSRLSFKDGEIVDQ